MAKYKKVKRYHRSFYSPGMWVKKAVGIIVLVAVVLVVAAGAFWTRLRQRMKLPCVPPPSSWPSRAQPTPSSP